MTLPAGPHILFLDIETSPHLTYSWGTHKTTIPQEFILEPSRVLCWSAQWLEGEMLFSAEWQVGHHAMIAYMFELLDTADVVVTWNGKSFDIPHLNREFDEAGLGKPSPFKQIDLCLVSRSQFNYASNRLGYISRRLLDKGKITHEGNHLWLRVLAGDIEAQQEMEEYNKRDTALLLPIYTRWLPWLPSHPHGGLYGGVGCPRCSSRHLQKRGYATTKKTKYRQYQCQGCRTYFRDNIPLERVRLQEVV